MPSAALSLVCVFDRRRMASSCQRVILTDSSAAVGYEISCCCCWHDCGRPDQHERDADEDDGNKDKRDDDKEADDEDDNDKEEEEVCTSKRLRPMQDGD